MSLARTIFRLGNYLGPIEDKTVKDALARHVPMGEGCACGEKVSISDWQAWMDHQYAVVFVAGRRAGPRFWE